MAGKPAANRDQQRKAVLERLAEGDSLSEICRAKGMPAWSTVHVWLDEDETFAGQVMRARETGYLHRADEAIKAAKQAKDPALGRLAFDAERWYLGKLSNAFSDKQKHEHSGAVRIDHAAAAKAEVEDLFGEPKQITVEAKDG